MNSGDSQEAAFQAQERGAEISTAAQASVGVCWVHSVLGGSGQHRVRRGQVQWQVRLAVAHSFAEDLGLHSLCLEPLVSENRRMTSLVISVFTLLCKVNLKRFLVWSQE